MSKKDQKDEFEEYIGKEIQVDGDDDNYTVSTNDPTILDIYSKHQIVRVLTEKTMGTADFRPDRINVKTERSGKKVKIVQVYRG